MSDSGAMSTRSTLVGAIAAVALIGAYLIGDGHSGSTQAAAAEPPVSGVTVLGTGTVSGTPDVLRLNLRVSAGRSSVDQALAAASQTMRVVRNSLQENGVADRDLKTSGLSVRPNYDYVSGQRILRGYRASESLAARLRDVDTAGRIIGEAAQAGGNAVRIEGIDLDLSSDSQLTKAARDEAFEDAKAKAEQYAAAAGRSLRDVQTISEDVSESPSPFFRSGLSAGTSADFAATPGVPIEAGTQRVSVQVIATWSLS